MIAHSGFLCYDIFKRIRDFAILRRTMSMRVAIFVDGANYFYMQKKLGWFIDAKKLLEYCRSNFGSVDDAYYYIGTDAPPEAKQDKYLKALTHMGYSLVTKPIKTIFDTVTGESKQKANLDVEVVLDMFNTIDNYDMAVLVSGDGDFERPLQLLKARGKKFKVLATTGLVAREILNVCGMHYIDFQDIKGDVEKI
jgi:uncharacterized LabA/DUF88 family protein